MLACFSYTRLRSYGIHNQEIGNLLADQLSLEEEDAVQAELQELQKQSVSPPALLLMSCVARPFQVAKQVELKELPSVPTEQPILVNSPGEYHIPPLCETCYLSRSMTEAFRERRQQVAVPS